MNTTFTPRAPKRVVTLAGLTAAAVALSACGDDPAPISAPVEAAETTTTVAAPAPAATAAPVEPAAPAAEAPRDAVVKISQTELGDVLADADGQTLYAFTNDVDAVSTCYGTCAEAWPPIIVDPDFIVSPGLDSGIFATTVREDGNHQLVAGKFPLYLFAADAKPGDITGHGSGDVWFAVDLGGRIIEDGAPPADAEQGETADEQISDEQAGEVVAPMIQLGDSELGPIVTDANGISLYLFTPDEAGNPTCTGDCAGTWPPLLIEAGSELAAGEGIDPALLSTVEHPDGGMQLKIGIWPLYYFAGDSEPGDVTGQGSGDKWFVVAADGKAIR
ncbi:MAG: hypothetical protein QNJ12_04990 [Ilumatobacter sp.]|uniref:hypothetical protein n=1 Tax=Ilumatobacter sp. TaxID=1967498 RepID=UPI002634298E|nr:hypothetical protein [Ilumatobacter sp.]MDJ0768124.1 hypothetical protein [Ilumatobacter sp.]